MSKASKKFFKEIEELTKNQQYDTKVVEKILNIVAVSKMLSDRESNEEVAKTLINISLVGESLAKKLYALKGK